MLKMTNSLLQWLQNVQKPLVGLFGTWFSQKLKKIGFLEVSLQTCYLWITKMHLFLLNLAPMHIYV